MNRAPSRPDGERLSAMLALLLLAYALLRLFELPALHWEFTLLGLLMRIDFNTHFVLLSLAGILAAAGSDWLIQSHPLASEAMGGSQHRIVPGLAALGLGAILARFPEGPAFVVGLAGAGIVLLAVFHAEYRVLDPEDSGRWIAVVGLRTLSILLLVGVLFSIRSAGLRSIFSIPLIFVATSSVAWRLLSLESPQSPTLLLVLAIGWMVAQLAWGLHYWPLPPVRASLLLGLAAYLGIGVASAQLSNDFSSRRILELGMIAALSLAAILAAT